jgi:hypothetical protein
LAATAAASTSAGFPRPPRLANGPDTLPDEGLSYVRPNSGGKFLLKEAVEIAGDLLLGADVMEREGGWNLLCKFFDNLGPIPHHMHQSDAFAKLVGQKGKPEAYYFPPQYNQIQNNFPHTYMGLEPGTTKEDIRRAWKNGTRATTEFSFTRVPIAWSRAQGGRSNPGFFMRRGRLSPTSRR